MRKAAALVKKKMEDASATAFQKHTTKVNQL